jgi:hypothetical protein
LLQTSQKSKHFEQLLGLGNVSLQKKVGSIRQAELQPSPFELPPSSQTSLPTRIPSPQTEEQLLRLRIEYPTSQRVHSVDAVVELKKHVEQLLTTVQSRTHEPETSK